MLGFNKRTNYSCQLNVITDTQNLVRLNRKLFEVLVISTRNLSMRNRFACPGQLHEREKHIVQTSFIKWDRQGGMGCVVHKEWDVWTRVILNAPDLIMVGT